MEAARSDTLGNVSLVVEQVCRLAIGAGVATGEVAWLVGELEAAQPNDDQIAEAAVAVSGMQSCISAVAHTVAEVGDRGGPTEIHSSAEALRRVAAQLEGLLTRLQPCVYARSRPTSPAPPPPPPPGLPPPGPAETPPGTDPPTAPVAAPGGRAGGPRRRGGSPPATSSIRRSR